MAGMSLSFLGWLRFGPALVVLSCFLCTVRGQSASTNILVPALPYTVQYETIKADGPLAMMYYPQEVPIDIPGWVPAPTGLYSNGQEPADGTKAPVGEFTYDATRHGWRIDPGFRFDPNPYVTPIVDPCQNYNSSCSSCLAAAAWGYPNAEQFQCVWCSNGACLSVRDVDYHTYPSLYCPADSKATVWPGECKGYEAPAPWAIATGFCATFAACVIMLVALYYFCKKKTKPVADSSGRKRYGGDVPVGEGLLLLPGRWHGGAGEEDDKTPRKSGKTSSGMEREPSNSRQREDSPPLPGVVLDANNKEIPDGQSYWAPSDLLYDYTKSTPRKQTGEESSTTKPVQPKFLQAFNQSGPEGGEQQQTEEGDERAYRYPGGVDEEEEYAAGGGGETMMEFEHDGRQYAYGFDEYGEYLEFWEEEGERNMVDSGLEGGEAPPGIEIDGELVDPNVVQHSEDEGPDSQQRRAAVGLVHRLQPQ